MKQLLTVMTLSLLAPLAAAHDPGLSELETCRSGERLDVSWRLHAEAISADALNAKAGDKALPLASFRSEQDGEEVVGYWRFDLASADYRLQLPALETMAHGHRVLAKTCNTRQRAVLSRFGKQWAPAQTALAATHSHDGEPHRH